VAAVVLLADQASKLCIQQHLAACDDSSLPIVPGWVAFAYTCNKGAAFGLLANETLLFVLIALVVIGMIVAYVRFLPANRPWLKLSLGLQLGGALGNLLDRLRQGYVVDFISVKAWPVFNIAHACVVVGVLILAYTSCSCRARSRERPGEHLVMVAHPVGARHRRTGASRASCGPRCGVPDCIAD
jgi:signal peptidase II